MKKKMTLTPKNMTDHQREIFTEEFYSHWENSGFGDRDIDINGNPYPWGCPWYWTENEILQGDDIYDMAQNFFKVCKPEIADNMNVYTM